MAKPTRKFPDRVVSLFSIFHIDCLFVQLPRVDIKTNKLKKVGFGY